MVLDFVDTIVQGVPILSKLRMNDNPDNPNAGLQSNRVIGTNKATFNYPIVLRQITRAFAGDDRYKNFTLGNVDMNQG